MDIRVFQTEAEVDRAAADLVREQIQAKPNTVLGLPTGGTPVGMYANLVADYEAGKVSFSDVTSFNLDEYIGLAPDHPCSYWYFMNDHLFGHVDCPNWNVPSGQASDPAQFAAEYEAKIASAGGIDLQVVGIGTNGHIGFNEPGTPAELLTHVTDLTENTIKDNARYFDSISDVPRQAMTMGIASILAAKKILFIAKGAGKADILVKAFRGPVTEEVPASFLQNHPDVVVLIDAAAAAKL